MRTDPMLRDAALVRSSRLRRGVAIGAAALTVAFAAVAAKAQPGHPRAAVVRSGAEAASPRQGFELAPPAQPPAATPASPQTSTGGS